MLQVDGFRVDVEEGCKLERQAVDCYLYKRSECACQKNACGVSRQVEPCKLRGSLRLLHSLLPCKSLVQHEIGTWNLSSGFSATLLSILYSLWVEDLQ